MENEVENNPKSNERNIKVLLMGSKKVGKSSLVRKIIRNSFSDTYDPTIYDEYKYFYNDKIVKFIENKIYDNLCIKFVDTGDFRENYSLFEKDILDSNYFFMIYSVEIQESFSIIKDAILKIKEKNIHINEKNCILIGNKIDMENDKILIDPILGHKAKVELQIGFIEISIKNNIRVNHLLEFIVDNEIQKQISDKIEKKICKCF